MIASLPPTPLAHILRDDRPTLRQALHRGDEVLAEDCCELRNPTYKRVASGYVVWSETTHTIGLKRGVAMRNRRLTATGPMHSVAVALICILVGPQTDMAAQEPLQPGARVRVTAPDCGLRGQATIYQALRADTLVLVTTECPMASVTRLEVSRGRNTHVEAGVYLGVPAGALATLAICRWVEPPCGDLTVDLAFFFGALGGLLGAIVGYAIETDRWEDVPVVRLRVGQAPQRDGRFGLGFSVSF